MCALVTGVQTCALPISPFSLLTGISLAIGYALLGSCWLIWKTTGAVQADAKRLARPLTPALLVAIAAVSAYTPFLEGQYYERWFASPGIRSEEHTSELQSLMRISYAVFCLKKKKQQTQ